MNNYDLVIGIEIHVELNTKTKMFSPAANLFGADANTNVDLRDVAYPGTLPAPNKEAVVKAIKLAKALNMKIDKTLLFDRKHYFYPDLPKGFQITQDTNPIGSIGSLPIFVDGNEQSISIERIQLEEDTAKSNHSSGSTLLDYNRAGVPLIEIITDPIIYSAAEAVAYVKSIRELVTNLDISTGKMEEGSLRVDVNISLKPKGSDELGTKVEIKNINSLKNIKNAILNEIEEQSNDLDNGKEILQATKRFDEATQKNVTMRIKTDAISYKFFKEPNINPITLSDEFIGSIENSELPWEQRKRFNSYSISESNVQKLIDSNDLAIFFDSLDYDDKEKLSKIFFSEVIQLLNSSEKDINELKITPSEFVEAIKKMDSGDINGKQMKEIIPQLVNGGIVSDIISKSSMKQITDESEIEKLVEEVISTNQDFISKNADRSERVIKYIIGNTMKLSKGQANPKIVSEIVSKKIGNDE